MRRTRITLKDADALDRLIPSEVFRAVWGTLESYRRNGLDLVSLSLTSPGGEGVHQAARAFAGDVAHEPGSGALLALDRGARRSHLHFHGLGLTRDASALPDRWRELAGAEAHLTRVTPVTGWLEHAAQPYDRKLAPNLTRIIWYAFKPWPPGDGRRSLAEDVFASGVFAAPWRAALAALAAPLILAADPLGDPSAKRRTCQLCDAPIAPEKRSHARFCSDTHRKAASADRCRARATDPLRSAP